MKSSIASKIAALRAMTTANGATEQEHETAARKVRELLDRYQLDASEVELRAEGTTDISVYPSGSNGSEIMFSFLGQVGRFTHCKVWRESCPAPARGKRFRIIGLRSDAEFAEWLLVSLSAFVQGAAMSWLLDGDHSENGVFKNSVDSFIQAACRRIAQRLQGDADASRALVPVRDKMVEEHFASLGLKLSHAVARFNGGDGRAAQAGHAAGDRAGFGRPVNGTGRTLQLGTK